MKRILEKKISEQLKMFPVIAISGPRQSGKTFLSKEIKPLYKYYNLEDINTKKIVLDDPVAFLNNLKEPVIIDEIQKIPNLLSQMQVIVDNSGKKGQFIITGSENLLLSEKIAQSLAGRVANNTLLPFSYQELLQAKVNRKNIDEQMLYGFYPRIYNSKMTPQDFYPEYVSTYVERDIRQIKNIGNLSLFEKFIQLLAGRVGQLVNLTSLSNDIGVSHNTVEQWISLLEASYIVFRLPPYHKNFGKRVIKSPKIFFHDVGLLCYLLGIRSVDSLQNHWARGNIFENLVISEIYKHIMNNKLISKMYFYRDSNNMEVDVLIESGTGFIGIEIKSSQTFSNNFLKSLKKVELIANQPFVGHIIYNGDLEQTVSGIQLHNFVNIKGVLESID